MESGLGLKGSIDNVSIIFCIYSGLELNHSIYLDTKEAEINLTLLNKENRNKKIKYILKTFSIAKDLLP